MDEAEIEQYRTTWRIPENAVEEVVSYYPNGLKWTVDHKVDGKWVARSHWEESGNRGAVWAFDGDLQHGPHREWYDNGQLAHETFYWHGKEHGVSRRWDYEGNLIGTYTMVHGTGLDLWYQAAGDLSEERRYVDGLRHGFERWYFNFVEESILSQEGHFKNGEEHGIFRNWNAKGGMRRGYPQYFVNGKKVSKRVYLAACKHDPFLPLFRPENNDYHREPFSALSVGQSLDSVGKSGYDEPVIKVTI